MNSRKNLIGEQHPEHPENKNFLVVRITSSISGWNYFVIPARNSNKSCKLRLEVHPVRCFSNHTGCPKTWLTPICIPCIQIVKTRAVMKKFLRHLGIQYRSVYQSMSPCLSFVYNDNAVFGDLSIWYKVH